MAQTGEAETDRTIQRAELDRHLVCVAPLVAIFCVIALQPFVEVGSDTRYAAGYIGFLSLVGVLCTFIFEGSGDPAFILHTRLSRFIVIALAHCVCLRCDTLSHSVLLRAASIFVFPLWAAKETDVTSFGGYLTAHFFFTALHVGFAREGWQWLSILLIHDAMLADLWVTMNTRQDSQVLLHNTSQVMRSLLGTVCDGCLLLADNGTIVGADPKATNLLNMEAEVRDAPNAPRIGSVLDGAMENDRLVRGLRMLQLPTGMAEERLPAEAYIIPCPMTPQDFEKLGVRTHPHLRTTLSRVHLCAFRLSDGGFVEPKAAPLAMQGTMRGKGHPVPSIGNFPGASAMRHPHGQLIQTEGSVVDSGLASPRTQAASAVGAPGRGKGSFLHPQQTPTHPGIPLNAIQAVGLGVGSYTKVRVVGRGTQGQVWQVTSQDGTTYAQKEIGLKGVLWHRDFPKRLRDADREVRALKDLAWASCVVVPIVDCWIQKDFEMSCIVMEWMPKNLDNVLQKLRSNMESAVKPEVACNWLGRLVAGLAAIHHAGFIHRDLKPSNILLDESQQQCKITDLGVSRALHRQRDDRPDNKSAVGSVVSQAAETTMTEAMGSILSGYTVRPGTPAYSSPEANETCHYGREADVYSLGMIATEMLSLQMPAEPGLGETMAANHAMEHAKKVLAEVPKGFEPNIWAELKKLCIAMLKPRSEDRPTTKEMAANKCLVQYVERVCLECPRLRSLLKGAEELTKPNRKPTFGDHGLESLTARLNAHHLNPYGEESLTARLNAHHLNPYGEDRHRGSPA